MKYRDMEWEPVVVTPGPHKRRIGNLDNEDSGSGIGESVPFLERCRESKNAVKSFLLFLFS
jgi:hypothetical protein